MSQNIKLKGGDFGPGCQNAYIKYNNEWSSVKKASICMICLQNGQDTYKEATVV